MELSQVPKFLLEMDIFEVKIQNKTKKNLVAIDYCSLYFGHEDLRFIIREHNFNIEKKFRHEITSLEFLTVEGILSILPPKSQIKTKNNEVDDSNEH